LPEALCTRGDENWLVPGGFFLPRDAVAFVDGNPSTERFPWLIAPMGKRWLAPHPDLGRSAGCCGLTFRSDATPNLVCTRGHPVGLAHRECQGPQWYALAADAEQQTERDPRPLGDLAPKLASVRALADGALPPLEPLGEAGGAGVDHESPEGWIDALWLEAPALACGGGPAAPAVSLRAKGLPAGRAVLLPTPWVQLVRLLCLDETPWGSPDAPLTWRADGGPTVNVSRHDELVLLTAGGVGAAGRLALVFDATEWTNAWAGLAKPA
ncbi:MAG TPA: hypothetical protein VFS00_18075, partial [Polyangiaceae bacterium]|nr:hypothetical protein [Polyangiaceae bacterium]